MQQGPWGYRASSDKEVCAQGCLAQARPISAVEGGRDARWFVAVKVSAVRGSVTFREEHKPRGYGGREGSPFQGISLKGQAVFWTCHLVHAKGKQLLLGSVLCLDIVQEEISLGTD